jgi:predicted DNA-binding transcriptional regulator AlpA
MLKDEPERFITEAEVLELTGLSRASIRRAELAGRFPARIKIGDATRGGRIAWSATEISAWMNSLKAARPRITADAEPPEAA